LDFPLRKEKKKKLENFTLFLFFTSRLFFEVIEMEMVLLLLTSINGIGDTCPWKPLIGILGSTMVSALICIICHRTSRVPNSLSYFLVAIFFL